MNAEPMRWNAVREAIDALYHAFRPYKLVGPILCEMTDRVIVPDGVPLRDRVAGDFERYAWKAITTLGDVDDYKHFLPRLIELAAEQRRRRTVFRDEVPCEELFAEVVGLSMVAAKLAYGAARSWPAEERAALEAVGLAWWWWELELPRNFAGGGPRDAMELLDAVGAPLDGHLRRVLGGGGMTDADLVALARFVNATAGYSVKRGRPYFEWVGEKATAGDPLEDWLLGAEVAAAMEAAFFRAADPEVAQALSDANRQLEWMRQARAAAAAG